MSLQIPFYPPMAWLAHFKKKSNTVSFILKEAVSDLPLIQILSVYTDFLTLEFSDFSSHSCNTDFVSDHSGRSAVF